MRLFAAFLVVALAGPAFAQDGSSIPQPPSAPATMPSAEPAGAKQIFPGITIDRAAKQIRLDCETLDITAPLEFLCVVNGTNEYESLLRSPVRPSNLHAALLMLGLQPGQPLKYSESLKKWIPPQGPPLHLTIEFVKNGKPQSYPAYRLMRDVKTKKPMPPMTWIFAGSHTLENGTYAADTTGYLVSVVNFSLTVIDIPMLASSDNETLEWEINKDLMPPAGTKATLIIEATGDDVPATMPATNATTSNPSADNPSRVTVDQAEIDRMQQMWDRAVKPHAAELREAAQAHYDVINTMRREQQRLIDEADRIQRKIDELEKSYQDMTTPRPTTLP